ncbi:hypothetical protein RI054_16g77330 [Pseudoscourfieldia marina]
MTRFPILYALCCFAFFALFSYLFAVLIGNYWMKIHKDSIRCKDDFLRDETQAHSKSKQESFAQSVSSKEHDLCKARKTLKQYHRENGILHFEGPRLKTTRFEPKQYKNRIEFIRDIGEQGLNGWGAELGVADGAFSRQILRQTKLARLFSIDAYESGIEHAQARLDVSRLRRRRLNAIRMLNPVKDSRSCLIWGYFSHAQYLFPNRTFDFIYIDGFAHTGEHGGKTFEEFYPKVRSGGVFGGHDYDRAWPKVLKAVDNFTTKHGLDLYVIPSARKGWDCCNSWFTVVP